MRELPFGFSSVLFAVADWTRPMDPPAPRQRPEPTVRERTPFDDERIRKAEMKRRRKAPSHD